MSVDRALLVELHHLIAEAASVGVEDLAAGRIGTTYPPEDVLTPDEIDALRALALSPAARSGLEKLIVGACGDAFFRFFSRLDPDPAGLREDFHDTWWAWREQREKARS